MAQQKSNSYGEFIKSGGMAPGSYTYVKKMHVHRYNIALWDEPIMSLVAIL